MAVDPKIAAEVANTLAKEIYGDALAPAMREIGGALGLFAQTMRQSGLEFGVITRERIERLFERALDEVPPSRRIIPPPEILGPVLEGVRYREEGTPIEEAFRRLLSRATDRERVSEAHPSFAGLIGRLSPDEALILQKLKASYVEIVGDLLNGVVTIYKHGSAPADLAVSQDRMILYLDNLRSCGLARAIYKAELTSSGRNLTPGYGVPVGERALVVALTPLGGAFVNACLSDP